MRLHIIAGREPKVFLDGIDITMNVASDGIEVDVSDPRMPRVHMTLFPTVVDFIADPVRVVAVRDSPPAPDGQDGTR